MSVFFHGLTVYSVSVEKRIDFAHVNHQFACCFYSNNSRNKKNSCLRVLTLRFRSLSALLTLV